ncbi:MAG: HEAT repeat domain-containing protein [Sedimentisphaerales bacterium]|nr:HEAT repeat domain-containing protein [Sedimentisphaerales bacterium]
MRKLQVLTVLLGWTAGAFAANEVEDLIQQLKDRDPMVKCDAAEKLGELGDRRAVQPLIELLEDTSGSIGGANVRPTARQDADSPGDSPKEIVEAAKLKVARATIRPLPVNNTDPSLLKTYLAGLKGRDITGRAKAAEELGKLRDVRAVPALLEVLNERDMTGRIHEAAIIALGEIGDPRAFDVIVARLNPRMPSDAVPAVIALGKLGDPRAIEPLVLVAKSNAFADKEAIKAIAAIGTSYGVKALNSFISPVSNEEESDTFEPRSFQPRPTESAEERMQRVREEMERNRELRSRSRSSRIPSRDIGSRTIPDRPNRSLPSNFSGFNSDYPLENEAKEALASLGFSHGLEPLLELLKHEDPKVRALASDALGEIGDPVAQKALKAATMDSDTDAGSAAREAMARSSRDIGVRGTQQSMDAAVRMAAAEALGKIGDPSAVMPLVRTMNDGNELVAKAAAQAIGSMKSTAAMRPFQMALYDRNVDVCKDAVRKLGMIGNDQAISLLARATQHSDLFVRKEVAAALGKSGNPLATKPLIAMLSDRMVQKNAIAALGESRDPAAVTPLLALLKDTSARKEAIIALQKIGDKRAVEPLIEVLKSNDPFAVSETIAALRDLRDKRAIEPLMNVARTGNRPMQDEARAALLAFGDPAAASVFVEELEKSPFTRKETLASLNQLGWKPVTDKEKVLVMVTNEQWGALEQMGQPAVDPLLEEYNRQGSRNIHEIARVLGQIGDRRAAPVLVKRMNSFGGADVVAAPLGKLGWKPSTFEEQIYFLSGTGDIAQIRNLWKSNPKVRQMFMQALNEESPGTITSKLISVGMDDTIGPMISKLNSLPKGSESVSVVNVFFNSGNKQLVDAAKAYCQSHDYEVMEIPGGMGSGSWGK